MSLQKREKPNRYFILAGLFLIMGAFSACDAPQEVERKLSAVREKCDEQRMLLAATHDTEMRNKEKELQNATEMAAREKAAAERSHEQSIAAKAEELNSAREDAAHEMAAMAKELERVREEARESALASLREGFRRGVLGLSPGETVEAPSRLIVWAIRISLIVSILLLGFTLLCLAEDETRELILGKVINIPIGLYIVFHLARPEVSEAGIRLGITRPITAQACLLAFGLLLAAFVDWLLQEYRVIWLECAALLIVTIVLAQFIIYGLKWSLLAETLGPSHALKILAAPLMGALAWTVFVLCREKARLIAARLRSPYLAPAISTHSRVKEIIGS